MYRIVITSLRTTLLIVASLLTLAMLSVPQRAEPATALRAAAATSSPIRPLRSRASRTTAATPTT